MKGEVGQGVRVASRTLDVKAVEVGAGNDDGDVEHVAVAGGWVRRDDGGGYIIRLQKVHWGCRACAATDGGVDCDCVESFGLRCSVGLRLHVMQVGAAS